MKSFWISPLICSGFSLVYVPHCLCNASAHLLSVFPGVSLNESLSFSVSAFLPSISQPVSVCLPCTVQLFVFVSLLIPKEAETCFSLILCHDSPPKMKITILQLLTKSILSMDFNQTHLSAASYFLCFDMFFSKVCSYTACCCFGLKHLYCILHFVFMFFSSFPFFLKFSKLLTVSLKHENL